MIVEANDSQIDIDIEESTDQTMHSSPEHPIIGIPITDTPVNYGIMLQLWNKWFLLLKYYATGNFLQTVGDFVGIDTGTASRIVWKMT
ncbi:unnamed protein product [Acanthoscelides obtectus]|uniref:Uncharacterized protein n=1 Tax=Acanthoscelides obtectus TaxID=200917 RepID=A0A9P0LD45_ACAOB|nr:unnamed protein product [Acanthoscelides obtectus]CAK1649775.1 hypothetical protein AOBTE_LOCUS16424 [Acanthoscelides obtectus]